jgi:exodeoxyribonuclease VII small subunit
MVNKNKELTFEENLKKLEDIVDKLESGNIDLEKSVELYEQGMILKDICSSRLKKVEFQINKIKLENSKIIKKNFDK